ncbi:uncharacterized protein LOC112568652 [Pomacea canaliculata]|uniref:uncharacterized protein LOC112568652 n=1 Tax=Pomacea canaliculata TaxID=400727 RepID=UPI000D72D94A|nr:uncharacterized protein LOC112568652 [Pomacea canaliculata]
MNFLAELDKKQVMSPVGCIVFMLLIYQSTCVQENCAVLEFHNVNNGVLTVYENQTANVAFWMNVSACDQTDELFKIKIHTRTNSGSLEYDGTFTYWKETCTVRPQRCLRCSTPAGPAELFRKVNRSHVQIEWEWDMKDTKFGNFTTIRKELKLNVSYPPSVTNLMVDGKEARGSFVINEGSEVNISCSFEKGNPSTNFLLLDKTGKEIKSSSDEQHLNLSLVLQCKDDWPTIRCQGSGSETNESVSLLVKCRPQFVDKNAKVVETAANIKWILTVKAHTTVIQKCLLMSLTLGENSNREVKCSLTGDPPDLLLIVSLDKEDVAKGGNWGLTLHNEKGSSDTLVFSIQSRE